MEFTLEFYTTAAGKCPPKDLLLEIRESDFDEYRRLLAAFEKLKQRSNHRYPLSKPLGDGLFELRLEGRLNTRFFYFFMVGRRIVVVHGVRHKAQAIPLGALETARTRMADWKARKADE